jgi:hypothetical protein
MRFLEPVRMADDSDQGPVWARSRRRRSGFPLVGLLVTLLALFGALTAVLAVKERSVAAGGATIDGWLAAGWDKAMELTGRAEAATAQTAEKAGAVADRTGDAVQAGVETTAKELKSGE